MDALADLFPDLSQRLAALPAEKQWDVVDRVVAAADVALRASLNSRATAAELRTAADAFRRRGAAGDQFKSAFSTAAAIARERGANGDGPAEALLLLIRAAGGDESIVLEAIGAG